MIAQKKKLQCPAAAAFRNESTRDRSNLTLGIEPDDAIDISSSALRRHRRVL